jgi:hypothetical protein
MTSQQTWAGAFIKRLASRLRAEGIEIGCVIIDENRTRRTNPVDHLLMVAHRQAKVARCSLATSLLRLVVFRIWMNLRDASSAATRADLPQGLRVFRVPSVNSEEAIKAVHDSGCEATCLLGTRILTKPTIQELGHLILNGHASDPRFVRGRPPVLWEVLNGDTHICVTVHQAIEKLDAGPIFGQRHQPIIYSGGLAATVRATMEQALVVMTDLFGDVLIGAHANTITPVEFTPGPVRTLPAIYQLTRAEVLCRRRTRSNRLECVSERTACSPAALPLSEAPNVQNIPR